MGPGGVRRAACPFRGHPDKEGKKRVELDAAGRQTILLWIDLNVPFYGSLMACDAQPTAGNKETTHAPK